MNTQNLLQPMLNFVKLAGLYAEKSSTELARVKVQQTKAASAIPALVDHLIATGAVDGSLRKEAQDLLSDHAETLGMLKDAVDKLAAAKAENKDLLTKMASDGGTAVPSQSGGGPEDNASLNTPFVGGRRIPLGKRASDIAFHRALHGIG